jgi:hypothetical protein
LRSVHRTLLLQPAVFVSVMCEVGGERAPEAAYRCIHFMEQHRLCCYEANELLSTIGVRHNSCTRPDPVVQDGQGKAG